MKKLVEGLQGVSIDKDAEITRLKTNLDEKKARGRERELDS